MSKNEIQVRFVDVKTGKVFAESLIPLENLPKTFEPKTTLHIGEDDWNVIQAEPMTAAEFARTGKLAITLEKVMRLPLEKILYILPTLCDEIPAVRANTQPFTDVFKIHEDMWRQFEMVSRDYQAAIDAEFEDILRIFREQSVDNGRFLGFKELHLRRRITAPLMGELTLSDLYSVFPNNVHRYEGLSYLDAEGIIAGGFAFDFGPLVIHGQEGEGRLKTFCILPRENPEVDSATVASALDKIMATHALYLVDWARVQRLGPGVEEIRSYLERRFY